MIKIRIKIKGRRSKFGDQNKKRLFEEPKIEYTLRSLNSLLKSINFCKEKHQSLKIKIIVIDDSSKVENLDKIENLLKKNNAEFNIVKVNHQNYEKIIKNQKNNQTFSNLASLLCSFEAAKERNREKFLAVGFLANCD